MAKGPKFLNPADRARKEARKKELKKNKKQREQVRSAAIKGRDPEQILAELENLDKLEYDPKNCELQQQSAAANMELIYKDKRKRLKELLQRILLHYQKEEPERYEELKKLETEYEVKHKRLEKEYTAIRAAKEVKIDEVFLPPEASGSLINLPGIDDEITDDDPLMSESIYITPLTEGVMPPGCPQGPPPDLKCLVDSLKDNLSLAQLMANTHIPPPNLPMPNSRNNERYHQRRGPPPNYRRPNQQPIKRQNPNHASGTLSSEEPPNELSTNKGLQEVKSNDGSKPSVEVKKTAVIESKPIIFIPKTTKFVPASVRSKLVPKPKGKEK